MSEIRENAISAYFAYFRIFHIFQQNVHIAYFSAYFGLFVTDNIKRILKYYFLILLLNK